MRGPTKEQLLETNPPELRRGTKIGHALLDLRQQILKGEYTIGQLLTTKDMSDKYRLNSSETQVVFLRLAIEGLIKISPAREKTWPYNAAYNEYRISDWAKRNRMASNRQGDFVEDISNQASHPALKKTLSLEVVYADEEVASLLQIQPGETVIFHRNLQLRDQETVVAICDCYLPAWFIPSMPKLKDPNCDIYHLMRELGKNPQWVKETMDVVQPSSVERTLFGLSPDDPNSLLKIVRQSFDLEGHPLEIQYLTDRGDTYRLQYTFPLYPEGVPEPLRDK